MTSFMSPAWADACAAAINAWPPPERKASKLGDFWDWIAMVSPGVNGTLALCVEPPPGGDDALSLVLEEGRVAGASVGPRSEAEEGAAFVLAGSLDAWRDLLGGYDPGKTVMYRRLMLRKGDTLAFFAAAFYWTELLTAIASVPAEVSAAVPEPA